MAFLEDVHLPRPDPKPTVVNEKRNTDFSGHCLNTHVDNRAENSLLTPQLFLRDFAQLQLRLLKSRRRLSADPQCVG